jgi:hypothetical protein
MPCLEFYRTNRELAGPITHFGCVFAYHQKKVFMSIGLRKSVALSVLICALALGGDFFNPIIPRGADH